MTSVTMYAYLNLQKDTADTFKGQLFTLIVVLVRFCFPKNASFTSSSLVFAASLLACNSGHFFFSNSTFKRINMYFTFYLTRYLPLGSTGLHGVRVGAAAIAIPF